MTIKHKLKLYKKFIKPHQDKDGFVNVDDCDSLLFSGLLSIAMPVRLWAANHLGNWFRRPTDYDECYKCGDSKSTISRDMLLGLMIGAWAADDHTVFWTIIRKAKSSYGFMGKGVPSRTFIGSLIGTAVHGWRELSGNSKDFPLLAKVPFYPSKSVVGFEAHLAVLHVYLREQMGLISENEALRYYNFHAEREPLNPLFLALSGQYAAAEAILMDVHLWPEDRLPRSSDRHSSWLMERDFGEDWMPTDGPDVEHNGADFIFCATLLEALRARHAKNV